MRTPRDVQQPRLFARAIVQGGACSDALYFTPEMGNSQGGELAVSVGGTGSDVAAYLRGKAPTCSPRYYRSSAAEPALVESSFELTS